MFIFKKNFFKLYLIFIFITSIVFLYNKFLYPTDWTTSEWLINYQGGFVRRGFSGELFFQINKIFEINIRYIVFYFNLIILAIFYILFFSFMKNIEINKLLVFFLYSPFFLVYPAAEPEVIARKEFLLFIIYIIYINLLLSNSNKIYIYLSTFLPIMNLIWDGIIFYLIFFFITFLFKKNLKKKELIYFFLSFIPYFISLYFVVKSSSLPESYELICSSLGEKCWGALLVLQVDVPIKFVLNYVYENINFYILLRYLFLFSLAFIPFLLFFYDVRRGNQLILIKNLIFWLYCLALLIIFFFHIIANDWGRWINIGFFFSFTTMMYFVKMNYVNFESTFLYSSFNNLFINNQKIYYFLFFIYVFTWNMKATMSDDIGSLPYYRIIVKFIKYLFV